MRGCLGVEVGVGSAASYKDTKNTQQKDSGETTGGNKNKLMFSSVRHLDVDINAARRRPAVGAARRVPHMFHSKSRIVSFSVPSRLLCCHSAICSMMQCGRFLFMIAQIS